MRRKDLLIGSTLFIIGIITRLPLVERMTSHTDASSYILALSRYDFSQDTPAPPGYPLYFALAKFASLFTGDNYSALLSISVLFSGLGALAFYFTGKSLFNRAVGVIAALIFLSASTFYFFGLTAYPYIMVAVVTPIIVLCVFQILFQKKQIGITFGIIYGISLGVRPQELITTLPLFLVGFYFLQSREKLKSLVSFILTSLTWFIPLMYVAGGISSYIKYSKISASGALPAPSLTVFIDKKFELASGLYLTLGFGIPILVGFLILMIIKYRNLVKVKNPRRKLIFIAAWVLPSIIFNFFVRAEHAGYQIGYLSFPIFCLAYAIYKFSNRKKLLMVIFAAFIVLTNLWIFFDNRDPNYERQYRQSSFHYTDLRRNDYALGVKVNYIKKHFQPENTLIVVGYPFWRQARYYLYDYKMHEIDALFVSNPLVMDIRRFSINHRYSVQRSKTYSFKIESGIKYLILFDDESSQWLETKYIKKFKGTTAIGVVPVKEGDTIRYGYNSLHINN